jgi:hypothetical protein
MFMRRRPLLRAAAVGGTAYVAGKKVAQNSAEKDSQDQRISDLEDQQAAPPAAAPAPDPGTAAGASLSDQLNQLNQLHTSGALSDEEFAAAKKSLLGI